MRISSAVAGQVQHLLSRLAPFSFLPEEEIEKMVKEAEKFAEEDKKKKEEGQFY